MRDESDHAFLTTLHRLQPATVQSLCAATGVTATAIRQRLLRLQSGGVVTRGISRGNRGRPFHTYSVTDSGLKSLGDDHAEMAAILWREIQKIESEQVRGQVLAGVKQALVSRFDVPRREEAAQFSATQSLTRRAEDICSRLTEYGFDIEVAPSAPGQELPVLKEHNCPYFELVEEDPSFCEFEQSIFSELIGAPVALTTCRQDGSGHCEFHVGELAQK